MRIVTIFDGGVLVVYNKKRTKTFHFFKGVREVVEVIEINKLFVFQLGTIKVKKDTTIQIRFNLRYFASELILATPEIQLEYKILEAAGIK